MTPAKVLAAIQRDKRYRQNLDWGKARPGHPEGTVRAHIAELEQNLARLRSRLTAVEAEKIRLLIHTHDSFKAVAKRGVAIRDPDSHASLARAFLAEFCADTDLLAMVQWHDEPFALYRQFAAKGRFDPERMKNLLETITDWDLFLAFLLVDGCTAGKSSGFLHWFLAESRDKVKSRFTVRDIITHA